MKSLVVLCVLVALVSVPAAAQRDVARRSYTFWDNSLTIQVESEKGGVLRILRGEHGRIEVAARAPDGFPAFALGGRENSELRLTSMGAEHADYLVVVPEDVRVRVSLPDRRHLEIASTRPSATFTWGAAADRAVVPTSIPPGPDGLYVSYASTVVPRTFAIGDLRALRRLEVRFEGSEFRVATSRLVSVTPGRADMIDFRPGDPPLDLVLTVPYYANDFRLLLAGKLALQARNGEVVSYCDQLVQQMQPGRIIFTYHPADKLICR